MSSRIPVTKVICKTLQSFTWDIVLFPRTFLAALFTTKVIDDRGLLIECQQLTSIWKKDIQHCHECSTSLLQEARPSMCPFAAQSAIKWAFCVIWEEGSQFSIHWRIMSSYSDLCSKECIVWCRGHAKLSCGQVTDTSQGGQTSYLKYLLIYFLQNQTFHEYLRRYKTYKIFLKLWEISGCFPPQNLKKFKLCWNYHDMTMM